MQDFLIGFLITLSIYQFLGWCFGAIYFSDVKGLTLFDWIFFVPGAGLFVMSFGIFPLITVLCTIPVFIDPNVTSLTLIGFGWYMCFSAFAVLDKEMKWN